MKVYCFIQARQGSQRFPNKILQPVYGMTKKGLPAVRPVIDWITERLKECKTLEHVSIITGNYGDNKELLFTHPKNCESFPLDDDNDVLLRYVKASKSLKGTDYVVRITGDCPFINAQIVDTVVDVAIKNKAFASNVVDRTFARGMDCEVFPVKLLRQWDKEITDIKLREHVTLGVYKKCKKSIVSVQNAVRELHGDSELNLCLDTIEDMQKVKYLYHLFTWDCLTSYNVLMNSVNMLKLKKEGIYQLFIEDKSKYQR